MKGSRRNYHNKKGLALAVRDGYKNAYSAIIDANLTTLLTAVVLFYFGSGPIKGFATTLIIGILTSLFCAIFITRLVFESRLVKKRKKYFFPTDLLLIYLETLLFLLSSEEK